MQYRTRRVPTNFQVELIVNRVTFDLRLVDVTPMGVKLEGKHDVVDGTEAELVFRSQPFAGTIRWVRSKRLGFQFAQPLPSEVYATLARERIPASERRKVVFS